jgi:tripartite-type tricarboxylate transporter receptor subunit TctC
MLKTVIVGMLCVLPLTAAAQVGDYPNKPIRMLTPAQPGGGTDILARGFGAKLADIFKQQVVVDNRASASGILAAEITMKAAPDGYTLFMTYTQHTLNGVFNPKLPYHPVNDFSPVSQLMAAGTLLIVNATTPVRTLKEFVEWTKNFKGPLNYGTAGTGSGGHLAGELYNMAVGTKAQHIAYKGAGPALIDLAGGQYHFSFAGMQSSQPLIRSGKLRAIAVTAPKRLAAFSDLPAMAEVIPGFEVVGWYGVIGPPRLPKPIMVKLHTELAKIAQLPDIRDRMHADGAEPVGSDPETFRRYLLADMAKWTKLMKDSGAKIN